MTLLTGKDFYLEFDGQNLSTDVLCFDDGMVLEQVEATTVGDSVRRYLPTRYRVEPRCKILLATDATGQAIREKCKVGTEGLLVWGAEGNGNGKPKWGIQCRVVSVPVVREYDAEVEIEVRWMPVEGSFTYHGGTAVF
jgi:hypothetical protein